MNKKLLLKTTLCSAVALCTALNAFSFNKLEKNYLANVALYMQGKDLQELSMVNKKCQETLLMLRRATIDDAVDHGSILCKLPNQRIQTLDFRGELDKCISIAKNINKNEVTRIVLYGENCEIKHNYDLNQALISCGLEKVDKIEMHGVPSSSLYKMLYDRNTFNKRPIIQLDPGNAFIGDSTDRKVIVKSVLIDNATNKEEANKLMEIFKDAAFYFDEIYYYDGQESKIRDLIGNATNKEYANTFQKIFNESVFYFDGIYYYYAQYDKIADYVLGRIVVDSDLEDALDEDAYYGSWDWNNILELISKQYEKRLRPAVYMEEQFNFDHTRFEDMKVRGLIEQDADETITLIKWGGLLKPIGKHPISLEAFKKGDYSKPNNHNCTLDVTGFSPGAPIISTEERCAELLIIKNDGIRHAIKGTYIPKNAAVHPSFWDQFFDYSGSEIVISEDINLNDLQEVEPSIKIAAGTITFCGHKDNKERVRIISCLNGPSHRPSLDIEGDNAPNKININDLYYSNVILKFSDLYDENGRIDLSKYELFNGDTIRHISLQDFFSPTVRPGFTSVEVVNDYGPSFIFSIPYLEDENGKFVLSKYRQLKNETTVDNICQTIRKNIPDSSHKTFRYSLVTTTNIELQLDGVFDDVYTAPNKRLVIHPDTERIKCEPKAGGGLTFVLSPYINYINKEFWQPGNSYVLNALFDNETFAYLKTIQKQHGIEISDRPDEFGFWNITKKKPF